MWAGANLHFYHNRATHLKVQRQANHGCDMKDFIYRKTTVAWFKYHFLFAHLLIKVMACQITEQSQTKPLWPDLWPMWLKFVGPNQHGMVWLGTIKAHKNKAPAKQRASI